jgi:hypothetical protein
MARAYVDVVRFMNATSHRGSKLDINFALRDVSTPAKSVAVFKYALIWKKNELQVAATWAPNRVGSYQTEVTSNGDPWTMN